MSCRSPSSEPQLSLRRLSHAQLLGQTSLILADTTTAESGTQAGREHIGFQSHGSERHHFAAAHLLLKTQHRQKSLQTLTLRAGKPMRVLPNGSA